MNHASPNVSCRSCTMKIVRVVGLTSILLLPLSFLVPSFSASFFFYSNDDLVTLYFRFRRYRLRRRPWILPVSWRDGFTTEGRSSFYIVTRRPNEKVSSSLYSSSASSSSLPFSPFDLYRLVSCGEKSGKVHEFTCLPDPVESTAKSFWSSSRLFEIVSKTLLVFNNFVVSRSGRDILSYNK